MQWKRREYMVATFAKMVLHIVTIEPMQNNSPWENKVRPTV
ncbi:hypothetical protein [Pelotomaculum terephthalicicum]|nr:hypothetical protein [Pelotomaculum terephthalicicum]